MLKNTNFTAKLMDAQVNMNICILFYLGNMTFLYNRIFNENKNRFGRERCGPNSCSKVSTLSNPLLFVIIALTFR